MNFPNLKTETRDARLSASSTCLLNTVQSTSEMMNLLEVLLTECRAWKKDKYVSCFAPSVADRTYFWSHPDARTGAVG